MKISVKNVGSYKGKKNVMLFAETPCDKIATPSRVLVDFGKTKELEPGEEEEITLTAGATRFASYDDDGRLLGKTGWVLPSGTYSFYAGENVADCALTGSFDIAEDTLLEELESAFKPLKAFERLTFDVSENKENGVSRQKKFEAVPLRTRRRGIRGSSYLM